MQISIERENQIIAIINYIHRKIDYHSPPFSFQKFFQQFPEYKIIPAHLPKGIDGEILKRGKEKIIRYRIGSRERTIRFTLAHEIGHSFLHREKEHRCYISREFRIYYPRQKNLTELEADFFAIELLAPLPMLDKLAPDLSNISEREFNHLSKEMAERFGINTLTMRARLKDLIIYRKWEEGEWL